MNIIDFIVIGVFLLFMLAGYYKGFVPTTLSICVYIMTCVLSFLLMLPISSLIRHNENIYNTMLYYTEGSEFINDPELARTNITELTSEQLDMIINGSEIPIPLGSVIGKNIAKEAYDNQGVTLLGDYFNISIVNFIINIITFLCIFAVLRIAAAMAMNSYDYVSRFPKLMKRDRWIGMGVGFVRAVFALFLVYTVVPIVLTVFNITLVHNLIDGSFFSSIFYKGNILLRII